MNKKKILFFLPTLGHGGAEKVLVNLVNEMNREKFSITVQTMFDTGIYREKLAPWIRYIGGLPWYFPGNTHLFKCFSPEILFHFYIRESYDLIVSYLEGPGARIVSACPEQTTKLISWIHISLDTEKNAKLSFRSFREAEICYGKFDKTICVSESVKEYFRKWFPEIRTEVLYNTVDFREIREKMHEPVNDICFRKDEINICSVGKLIKTKGYDRVIPAVKRLRDEGIPLHIYHFGTGRELRNLKRAVYKNGLENCFTFAGFRKNPYKYMAASDFYLCSSRREGFSTAVTEALITGTPVIATDCAGSRELLGENEYGILTGNSTEGIYRGLSVMLKTDGLKEYYRKQAEERAQFFNSDQTVKKVEDMLLELFLS